MSLILTRKVGEVIRIGEHIAVTIKAVNGAQVRIAIEAPPDVKILREELIGQPKKEKRE